MVAELSGRGHAVCDLLEAAGLARSSYYYALAHPQQPTRAYLRPKVAQIFSRTPNGCGHRQVAMCLRAEEGERIADKTVLKMMGEMGLRCGIRRERAYHRYNSYKGDVGQSFDNIIGRDFKADGPWQKLGTDVTEFKLSFGKAYLAPVYDFASKEIVAHSISMCPNLAQQQEMLQMLMDAKPAGVEPILHSDMGWQYQHKAYISALADNGFIQSMSRKGNCIDNGATTWPKVYVASLDDGRQRLCAEQFVTARYGLTDAQVSTSIERFVASAEAFFKDQIERIPALGGTQE